MKLQQLPSPIIDIIFQYAHNGSKYIYEINFINYNKNHSILFNNIYDIQDIPFYLYAFLSIAAKKHNNIYDYLRYINKYYNTIVIYYGIQGIYYSNIIKFYLYNILSKMPTQII
jgi:hypothetical protein|tara:strand:- start:1296 stop:1637 length:342 start_codon:yes stop_codon:yes gene_type:complete